jgi:rRNA maturation endonuclease Nob1
MYVCEKCHREFNDKPNGRCPNCGGLVRKNLEREKAKGNRHKFQKARKMKRGEDW